jgi:tetratricopeptide (TPR) repeat protein
MRDSVYDEFNIAKKNNDIDMVEKLYMENPNESIIGICYAKMLLKKRRNVEAEIILLDLVAQGERLVQAYFSLGRINIFRKNYDKAKYYFLKVLELREDTFA